MILYKKNKNLPHVELMFIVEYSTREHDWDEHRLAEQASFSLCLEMHGKWSQPQPSPGTSEKYPGHF